MLSAWRAGIIGSALVVTLLGTLASCQGPATSESAPAAVTAMLNGAGNDGSRDCLFVGDDPTAVSEAEVDYYAVSLGEGEWEYLGEFVETGEGGLLSPRGLVFEKRGGPNAELLVADQNAGQPTPSEVLRYDSDGDFLGALIPFTDPNAPFAARGIVVGKHHILYVADMGDQIVQPPAEPMPGRLATFDARTGEFLGDLEPCAGFEDRFYPRGVVIGPEGDVYVSVVYGDSPLPGGAILRFDEKTGQCVDVVVTSEDCMCGFNRPDGIVFGPDGNIYVTSARSNGTGINAIFVFDPETGEPVDYIDLQTSIPTALVFGPGGDLYLTITGGPDAGSVRRYDVDSETYDVIVSPGTTLERPFYLTFCNTNPATLAYEPRGSTCCRD